ncbi:ATP-grasp domain-containing protein [Alkalihalobacterium chitinilyticum]|uniref:ATP-grasp domain-containing protein n=1 Tax=Alkalihalobacterium chitinilyticum TaxID=2980103 RepID=A0ABT5VKY0_9BACI|nr:ATP-grasp domain-containing protein [Alkalihalobacterium chitinilyticum]MDE5415407.1 ATP-grasp domain-containing protein [Alkalihalobacterium chitinilyticum]
MNVLLIGLNKSWAETLNHISKINLYVIEEPDLWKNKRMSQSDYPNIKEVKLLEYQFKEKDELNQIINYANSIKADVIIPGLEYSVAPASYVASTLNLPNLGVEAANTLTNKHSLRKMMKKTKVSQPRYKKVSNIDEVREFFEGPIVIKPSNRQASAGVIKVYDEKDIETSWEHSRGFNEGVHVTERNIKEEFLVEELLTGQEISVEVLVSRGNIKFFNVTVKETMDGKFPVEIGHYLPGNFPEDLNNKLKLNIKSLINQLDIQTGILHAEWIIVNETPYLIECAGRAPGDYIFQMIKLAYDFCPYTAMLDIYSNEETHINPKENRGVAITFLSTLENGYLKAIKGLDDVKLKPEVLNTAQFVEVGGEVTTLKSSWDRLGMIMCSGTTGQDALENTRRYRETVIFEVESTTVTNRP